MQGRKLLALAVFLLLLSGCANSSPRVGSPAPDFRLLALDGEALRLRDFGGRPVLVNFWATWCGPCRQEMPLLEKVYRERARDGLVILAVDVGEEERAVSTFVREFGLTFPVLLDSRQEVAWEYRILGLPTSVFIDRRGIIHFIKLGPFYSEEEMRSALELVTREK